MRRHSLPIPGVVAVLCLVAAAASAKPVEERRPLAADGMVTIKNINGSVTVEGWNRKEIEITGTLSGDVEDVDISGTESRLRIEVRYPENRRRSHGAADLDIKVPVGASVRVDVVNAPIGVSKVDGELELQAVNGDITVSDKPAGLEAKTVNGTIEVTGAIDRVEAESVGGRIRLEGVAGQVSAATVGGSIGVRGGPFERARLSSVSGPIDFAGALAGRGEFEFESHNGDVVLVMPASVSAEFDLQTFSGDIDNAFGPAASKRGYGPGRTLSFSTRDGDARVTASTFSGDIRLVKQ